MLVNIHPLYMVSIAPQPEHAEGTEKPSLVRTIEIELLKSPPNIDAVCGFIELLAGQTANLEDFPGEMQQLRHAGKIHYLLYLKVLLDQKARELRGNNGSKEEIERLEMHALIAQDAYDEVLSIQKKATTIPPNPVEIAPTGSPLTQQGDLYRVRAKGILKKAS